ncbi:uncharacterized protein DEA37_0001118 [Paragonimus westermani]|uniref:FERM domain-containing protein n=1 Tax=Paragonimus westermani TaxID=34504 RepID=A0A5J4NQP5_9TREM|nr:uncharacterized protein DEA37_0001118 [Paragonimus westermani]
MNQNKVTIVTYVAVYHAEIGDYDLLADYLGEQGTLADLKMFANVTPRTESRICDLHKTLKGMTMEEAENKFLDHASRFETYGIEPIYVQLASLVMYARI